MSFFPSFGANFLATLLGGIFLALLFFLSREKWLPLPDITGRWYFEMRTLKTAYNPYKGMILRYVAIVWREGTRIEGTVEKIYENSSTGEREYVGEDRTRGTLHGYVQKNYFGRDRVFLHVVEKGHGRESTNFYDIRVLKSKKLSGTFASMVADQEGEVSWQREPF